MNSLHRKKREWESVVLLSGRNSDRGHRILPRRHVHPPFYAAHNRNLKAAVAWYGQIKPEKQPGISQGEPLDVISRINPPILGLYGEADLGIPAADVREMEAALGQRERRQNLFFILAHHTHFLQIIDQAIGLMAPSQTTFHAISSSGTSLKSIGDLQRLWLR